MRLISIIATVWLSVVGVVGGGEASLVENFDGLDAWGPLIFPRIDRHSVYTVEIRDGVGMLVAASENAASGVLWTERFDPHLLPVLRWRWKIDGVLANGDARVKRGDDYALRIAVIFRFEPGDASLGLRMKYKSYKMFLGDYPPHSSLHYIWANRRQEKEILPNPRTPRTMLIVMQTGDELAGEWLEESMNILADYRKAFGEEPPHEATIAVMCDSDDTGGKARGYVDWIRVDAE